MSVLLIQHRSSPDQQFNDLVMIKYGTNNIGKLYFGSNSIGKAYLGNNLIFQKGGGGGGGGGDDDELPAGYTRMTYIEAPRWTKSFIATGVIASNNIGFEIDALVYDSINQTEDEYGCLLGARYSSNSDDFQLTTYTADNSGFSGTLRLGGSDNNFSGRITQGVRFTAKLNGTTYTVNGTSTTVSRNIGSNAKEIYLFALNQNGIATQYGHARIYSFKLTNSGTTILDFVPCKRDSDNRYGFYDTISQSFFTPNDYGMLYGVDETADNSYDSTVPYLEFTGAQSINLGIGAHLGSTSIEIQCQGTGAGGVTGSEIVIGFSSVLSTYFASVISNKNVYGIGGADTQQLGSSTTKGTMTLTFGLFGTTASRLTVTDGTSSCYGDYNISSIEYFHPFRLGGAGRVTQYYSNVKIWYVKIYEGQTLVRDLVPVSKNGVGYFYDNVTGRLFGISESTPLIIGTN